ncbi:MAG: 3-deoxy-7-phosphoheptulonate synthase [Planctomycetes bacterium]|nr:3-deoxy-7-phosphoheptulonate synthase [Planctomycetota bacterium]
MLIRLKSGSDRTPLNDFAAQALATLIESPRPDVVALVGTSGVMPAEVLKLSGVEDVALISTPFKLSSRQFAPDDRVVDIDGISIGDGQPICAIAGPCSFESVEQALKVAKHVQAAGAKIIRGGLFKPRTSPFSFQGLGKGGLDVIKAIRAETDLKIVTEAIDAESLELVAEHADMVQIGARNMQNFSLLTQAGRTGKPVLLKRGMSATVDEWLTAADYILATGNENVVLCERGVRTFVRHSRNTLDLAAIPCVKQLSCLPVIIDASHGVGVREWVAALTRAGVVVGADGFMVEVHHNPAEALSDGDQSLLPSQFDALMKSMPAIAQAVGRSC